MTENNGRNLGGFVSRHGEMIIASVGLALTFTAIIVAIEDRVAYLEANQVSPADFAVLHRRAVESEKSFLLLHQRFEVVRDQQLQVGSRCTVPIEKL